MSTRDDHSVSEAEAARRVRAAIDDLVRGAADGAGSLDMMPTELQAQHAPRRPMLLPIGAALLVVVGAIAVFQVVRRDNPVAAPDTRAVVTTTAPVGDELLDALRGELWVLAGIAADTTISPVLPFVEFGTDNGNIADGFDGCNWYGSKGELAGDALSITETESTAIGCDGIGAIAPLDGDRTVLSADATHVDLHAGASSTPRLTYRSWSSTGTPATADQLLGMWSLGVGVGAPRHTLARLPAVTLTESTATIGTCTALTWSIEDGLLQVDGFPADDPYSCISDGATPGLDRFMEDLLAGGVNTHLDTDGTLWLRGAQFVFHADRTALPEAPATAPLVLYVSNQSFEDDPVHITVTVDGDTVVDDEFLVLGQHNWIPYELDLAPGVHELTWTSNTGPTGASTITVPPEGTLWAVLNYWYYPPEPREFSFETHDTQPLFS